MYTLLLNKTDRDYLDKCAISKFSFGIIIGQQVGPQNYVAVHIAKNSDDDDVDDTDLPDMNAILTQEISEIDIPGLSQQWISACKMIPGSFEVLGIFAAGEDLDLADSFIAGKDLMDGILSLLKADKLFSEVMQSQHGYIFLVHNFRKKTTSCKYYSGEGDNFTPMDCTFVEKPLEWFVIDSSYEIGEVFPLSGTQQIDIEKEFYSSIKLVRQCLKFCEVFIEDEAVNDKITLDAFMEQKRIDKAAFLNKNLRASIFLPYKYQNCKDKRISVLKFDGIVTYTGIMSSKVCVNTKATFSEIKKFLFQDILRSLAARSQVYCDALTDPYAGADKILRYETPRRIYFGVNASEFALPIQFSEYLFRGEAVTVAVAQAKRILDLKITPDNIIEVEHLGHPTEESLPGAAKSPQMGETLAMSPSSTKMIRYMYVIAIGVTLFVLILSIVLHFFLLEK